MRIDYELDTGLPPLSWCARARANAPVQVRHGSGVETRAEGFVEGAWDGDFDAFDFDRAQTLSGTGGRLRDDSLVLAAPFHPLERLFVLEGDQETLASNSLVFLLAACQDTLDLTYPRYFFDLLAQVRRGITPPETTLRTASGRRVRLYPCCNVELRPDLRLHRRPKALGSPPGSYADYFDLLVRTSTELARNAAAPGRGRSFHLVAACSRGYDSTAAAAVASLAGCREGVTFARSSRFLVHPLFGSAAEIGDDSGADSLRALGMTVHEYDRTDLQRLPGHPKAEFYISALAVTDATTAVMENVVRGSVFVSGRHGERYWGPTRRSARKNFREVDDCYLSGHSLGEFRLRVGFLHYPVAYVGARHGPAIFRITHSPEMRRWRLGTGYYDRPIARRIAEQAGVPRQNFGQQKLGAGSQMRELSAESEADFQAFVQSQVPVAIRQRLDLRPLLERTDAQRRVAYLRTHYAHWPMVSSAIELLGIDRLHVLWNSIYQYQFHWGFEKIAHRYR